jgi:hypothetical protein
MHRLLSFCALALAISTLPVLSSCGGSSTNATTTTTTTNAYAAAYQKATFASGVTVSYPSSCEMTIAASGLPYQHQVYYLAPVTTGGTVVATTPSGIQLGVIPYSGPISTTAKAVSATFNTCPTKAASTTTTGMGAIGFIFSGTVLFNPYEATSTVALGDNASYTFASSACGGSTCTASFLDPCNQHTAGGMGGSTWHYHGNPNCWTAVADGSSNGPSHIIGIALDGYPIYGGRDINGAVVAATSLDSCNGITSPTPEFPSGAYHYVLPIDSSGNALTTKQSSINCYAGTVSATLSAAMQKLGCRMPFLLANGKARLPDGREVSRSEAMAWMQKNMPTMQPMPGMQMAAATTGRALGGS